MKLEELGERSLIERIVRAFPIDPALVSAGAGEDDCAVLDLSSMQNGYRYLLVTTDTLQESTHFPRGMTPFQKGWSAVAVNLSDIAAMGGSPFAFVLALGIPAGTEAFFIDDLVAGIAACASAFETAVVGGDITRSTELILTGTCLGLTSKPLKRSGARVGDVVCVTGSLGNAALALKLLNGELHVSEQLEPAAKWALFQPQPRIREGFTIAHSGVATAMIDISDGLALSIAEIAKMSGVGAELFAERIPVLSEELRYDEQLKLSPQERTELALYYGGDYELLFTLDPRVLEDAALLSKLKQEVGLSVIGTIVPPEEGLSIRTGDDQERLELKGYQHF
ncbi:MAG TPA: thiamine-phosphate kinase [Methanomicrobia archaeon]|nr:thiamine-phosphate kinase [Methanomicrobia archaeon]